MFRWSLLLCLVGLLATPHALSVAQTEPEKKDTPDAGKKDKPDADPKLTASKGKPLSTQGRGALDYLVKQQQPNGTWNSGPAAAMMEGTAATGGKGAKGTDSVDVGSTSMAALALMRAGYTPKSGTHSEALRKAVANVIKSVESSDSKSLSVTERTGTQIQRKIGDNADTYLAAVMLATAKGKVGDEKLEARLEKALQKIVNKMEANQKADGTWNGTGWAPVLSQAMASKAINMAKQVGMKVDKAVLDKTAKQAKDTFQKLAANPGGAKGAPGGILGAAAGVDLYATAAAMSALQDAVNTHRALSANSQSVLRSVGSLEQARKDAKLQLEELNGWEKDLKEALKVMVKKVKDNKFVQGFGSDGGEEFLSFWLIGEALKLNQLKDFSEWDKMMEERLAKSQNANGSFSGKHCITGETFCTSAAMLTMMSDRALHPEGSHMVQSEKPAETVATQPSTGPGVRADLNDTPATKAPAASEADLLLKNLLKTLDEDRTEILAKLRDGKGGEFTDALVRGAAQLKGEAQRDTRAALAERLTRMNAKTLRIMLADEDAELRRAAAAACGMKTDKQFVPDLIAMLSDAQPMVVSTAHSALKQLSGQDFGPEPNAEPADKAKAVLAWRKWWNGQAKQ